MDRLTVQEAADRLGVKEDAVRKRIQRGSLVHEKEDGRVYVYLDVTQDAAQDAYHPQAQVEGDGELVDELRDHIRFLRGQLDEERESRRRADTIIAQLTQANASLARRVPELEAPSGSRDGRDVVAEYVDGADAPAGNGGPQTDSERPWWRRWFGG